MIVRSQIEKQRVLQALHDESAFFDGEGYGRTFRSIWRPTLLLRDSPACINYRHTNLKDPCSGCPFFYFVPPNQQDQRLPCHHIPLNLEGETIAGLYARGTQESLDRCYRNWLQKEILDLKTSEEVFMQTLQTVNKISFKNILFLTDFSEASSAAMSYAIGLSRHYQAQLYAGHSCDPVILTETAGTNIIQEVEDSSRAQLVKLAKQTGPTSISLFSRGSIADAVPKWINEHGIDLIIMGTHGRHGLQRFFLGSTAEAIIRSATCPVLTVGPHVTTRPHHGFTVESILFPTDLGVHAEFAAQWALSAAQENCAAITFMHVIPPAETFERDASDLVNRKYQHLNKIVPPDAKEWCKPGFVVELGDPVKELLRYAETERPDLIVLGLPAGKTFNGHFRTGVTYNVIAGAPCPVLTIRDLNGSN